MAKDNSPQRDPAERIRQDLINSASKDDALLTRLAKQQACSCSVTNRPAKPEEPTVPEEPGKPDEPGKPVKPDEPVEPGKPDEPA